MNMKAQPSNRSYTKTDRVRAIELCEEMTISEAARKMSIPYSTVRYWKERHSAVSFNDTADSYGKKIFKMEAVIQEKIDALHNKLEKLKKIRSILDDEDF